MSQPNPEWASRIGKNGVLWRYPIQPWQELHVFCVRPVTESVKLTTSFRSTVRSDQRRKAHGQVIQGKKMSIYTDPLLCKEASLIHHHSPRYCHQNCEIPVRGKEYLEGYRGRQWTMRKTQHSFLWRAGRVGEVRGPRWANISSASPPLNSMLTAGITN